MKECQECGKSFCVLYPNLWVFYRRTKKGKKYWYCSNKCIREHDKKEEEMMKARAVITEEQKKKAVEIALAGESPLPFLKECGSANPSAMWYAIKQDLDDDTLDKLPRKLPAAVKTVETPEGEFTGQAPYKIPSVNAVKVEPGYVEVGNDGQEIPPKIFMPVVYDGFTVREVEGQFGRYRYNRTASGEFIDYENKDGMDVISFTVDQWRDYRDEQVRAARVLGVEL